MQFHLLPLLLSIIAASVVDLTPENFDDVVGGSKHVFVKFYAPWCGHCKNLAPTWEELGNSFQNLKKDIVIAKLDADAHRDLGSRFGIQGFPTLKWFPKNTAEPEDYQGGRDLKDFLTFIQDKTGLRGKQKKEEPSNVVVLTDSNFDEIVHKGSANVLVEFYAPWCGHCKSLAPTYEKLAKVFKNEKDCLIAKVDATEHTKAATQYDVQGYPTLKFFSKSDDKPIDYNKGRDLESFVTFLNEHCGTHRTSDGGLTDLAGIVEDLETVIKKFTSSKPSSEKAKKEILKSLETAFKDLHAAPEKLKKNAYVKQAETIYKNIFEKTFKKGQEYITNELARLERMLSDTSKISLDKIDQLTLKRNILKSISLVTGSGKENIHAEL